MLLAQKNRVEISLNGQTNRVSINAALNLQHALSSSAIISSSATITALTGSYQALIASPTASGDPNTLGLKGVDGQMLPGTVGGVHYVYVYMANRWRSSSLS